MFAEQLEEVKKLRAWVRSLEERGIRIKLLKIPYMDWLFIFGRAPKKGELAYFHQYPVRLYD